MAKKKKLLKKLAKAALIGGALYGASKLGKKGNVLKTAAHEDANINVNPLKTWSPGGDATQHIPKWKMPDDPRKWEVYQAKGGSVGKKGGGIAKRGMGAAYKSGGRVKSMGIAKRGGGVAKR